ncbi:MAG: hypothetical protein K2Z81_23640, partial [Cyanobacteria bacterium]|nr:hypothetical protein [Cyanobacteriota bacterium]
MNYPLVKLRIFDSITGKKVFFDRTKMVAKNYDPTFDYERTINCGPMVGPPRADLKLWDQWNVEQKKTGRYAGIVTLSLHQSFENVELPFHLKPGLKPTNKAANSTVVVSNAILQVDPERHRWAFEAKETQYFGTHSLLLPKRSGLKFFNRFVQDPAVSTRVETVGHMGPKDLDTYFNMVLLDDIYDELNTGDVILFRGSEYFSMLIRATSRSNWSHVAILIRDPPPAVLERYAVNRYQAPDGSPLNDSVYVFEADSETLLENPETGFRDGIQLVPIRHWMQKYVEEAGDE